MKKRSWFLRKNPFVSQEGRKVVSHPFSLLAPGLANVYPETIFFHTLKTWICQSGAKRFLIMFGFIYVYETLLQFTTVKRLAQKSE